MALTDSPEFTSSGLVRRLAEAMFTGVPTHPDWAESLACTLVGVMLGMERFISNKFGKLYGNIMVIYVGASGLSFKTVPLKKAVRPILKLLTDGVNNEVCRSFGMMLDEFKERWENSVNTPKSERKAKKWKVERLKLENIKRNMVDYEAPQRFTSEALITWLTNFPQGMIAGDEYTKMVKGSKTKDYLSDVMEDLSRMYDCDMEKVGTQVRGIEYPQNAYISFASATTFYLLTLMDDSFFIQGTGNRILWILDDVRSKIDVEKETLEGKFFWGIEEDEKYEQLLMNLVGKLMNIRSLPEGIVTMSLDASIELDRYRATKYNEAVELFTTDLLNKDANLIARLAQNAMKLSLIHCVGRYAWTHDPNFPVASMEISKEDALWAIAKMERHLVHYGKLRVVSARVRETTTRSYLSDQERVRYTIKRFEGENKKVTKTMIMQATGWLKDDCQAILDAMLATEQIEMYTGMSGIKKVTYYTLPKKI